MAKIDYYVDKFKFADLAYQVHQYCLKKGCQEKLNNKCLSEDEFNEKIKEKEENAFILTLETFNNLLIELLEKCNEEEIKEIALKIKEYFENDEFREDWKVANYEERMLMYKAVGCVPGDEDCLDNKILEIKNTYLKKLKEFGL